MVRLFSGLRSNASRVLQWSHVFSDMVRMAFDFGTGINAAASMEPCLFRHGKVSHL